MIEHSDGYEQFISLHLHYSHQRGVVRGRPSSSYYFVGYQGEISVIICKRLR